MITTASTVASAIAKKPSAIHCAASTASAVLDEIDGPVEYDPAYQGGHQVGEYRDREDHPAGRGPDGQRGGHRAGHDEESEQHAGRAPGHHGGDSADGRAGDDDADAEAALQRAPPSRPPRSARIPPPGGIARSGGIPPSAAPPSAVPSRAVPATPSRATPSRATPSRARGGTRRPEQRPAGPWSAASRPAASRGARRTGSPRAGQAACGSALRYQDRRHARRKVPGPARHHAGRAGLAGRSPGRRGRDHVPGDLTRAHRGRPSRNRVRASGGRPSASAPRPAAARDRRAAWLRARRRTACSGVLRAIVGCSYVLRMLVVAHWSRSHEGRLPRMVRIQGWDG